jgi:hypothetical protein
MKGARFADVTAIQERVTEVLRSDFFLFPRLKSIMKGARFADVAAIQERVTEVLRSIPKEFITALTSARHLSLS